MTSLSIQEVFGPSGLAYRRLIDPILAESVGTRYSFVTNDEFGELEPERQARVYWEEILYRAHWSALSNLIRHSKWWQACHDLSVVTANFLGFCAALRSMVEAAADAQHSLGRFPLAVGRAFAHVVASLEGKAGACVASPELEDALIHYICGRRLSKSEADAPASHTAKPPAEYLKAINITQLDMLDLYGALCQVVHPAAPSIAWLVRTEGDSFCVSLGQDHSQIATLCGRFAAEIEWTQQCSVNSSLLTLRALNALPVTTLHTRLVSDLEIPGWQKVVDAINQHRS